MTGDISAVFPGFPMGLLSTLPNSTTLHNCHFSAKRFCLKTSPQKHIFPTHSGFSIPPPNLIILISTRMRMMLFSLWWVVHWWCILLLATNAMFGARRKQPTVFYLPILGQIFGLHFNMSISDKNKSRVNTQVGPFLKTVSRRDQVVERLGRWGVTAGQTRSPSEFEKQFSLFCSLCLTSANE